MKPSAEALAQAAQALQQALQHLHIPFDPTQFRWEGVLPLDYKEHAGDARGMGWRGITRYNLGRPPYIEARFALRYFEIEPDGYSSLEKHAHVHLVVVIRGRGRALVGNRVFELKPFDIVYVPPNTPHRWVNPYRELFGFLCPVDAERDKPQPISEAEWQALRANPETAPYVF
ncbi:MAG: cupin domain-containing protein [Fimbriimonadales bacterium]|nr:cupin domain-containing protein [Fimbriimonadales bacterium]